MSAEGLKKIGIFIFENVEELDFVGPYEVFCMINTVQKATGREALVDVRLISETGQDVTGVKNMRVGAHAAMADVSDLDVICIPGGIGARALLGNEAVLEWVRNSAQNCEWVTSVCTGAFVLSKAGLTEGRRMTTYWGAFDEFKERGLSGELVPHVRYVRDGHLVTSAGVSAGIDMALWLTGQMFSPALARWVQRGMQYDPAPPYTAEV